MRRGARQLDQRDGPTDVPPLPPPKKPGKAIPPPRMPDGEILILEKVQPKDSCSTPPISVRTRRALIEHWSPKAILLGLAGLLTAVGGPALSMELVKAWTAQSAKLDQIQGSITSGQARAACQVSRIQARQSVSERNLRLIANQAAAMNGGPANGSMPSDEVKVERPLGGGPVRFGTKWEDFPEPIYCSGSGGGDGN